MPSVMNETFESSGIANASAALRKLAALRKSMTPEGTDAIQVLDTASALGASSAAAEKQAMESAAKQPPPKITVDLTTGRMTADVPIVSPMAQVTAAKADPWAKYADTLATQLEQRTRIASNAPSPEQLPDDPRALAQELGIEEPQYSVAKGFFPYRREKAEYERLLQNPVKLKQAAMKLRMSAQDQAMDSAGKAANALKSVQATERAEQSQVRQEAITRENFLQHMLARASGFESPEKFVETIDGTMKNVFGEPAAEEEKVRAISEYATAKRKRLLEDAKETEKNADNDEDRRISSLRIEKLEKDIDRYDKPKEPRRRRVSQAQSFLDRATADTLIARAGDERYDEDSAFDAIEMASEQWSRAHDKNNAEAAQNLAVINAPGTAAATVAKLKERNKALANENRRLIADRNKLVTFLGGEPPAAAITPPAAAARKPGTLQAPAATKKADPLGIR